MNLTEKGKRFSERLFKIVDKLSIVFSTVFVHLRSSLAVPIDDTY